MRQTLRATQTPQLVGPRTSHQGISSHATAIGAEAVVADSNSIVLGRGADTVRIPGNAIVLGTTTLTGNLTVSSGLVTVGTLGSAGGPNLCRNASNQLSTCSSSLRYKTGIKSFTGGLDIVRQLRPFSFTWKDGGLRDLGLGAEDVEKVEPLLVTHNAQGQVEGVKYDRVAVVLLNAVNQQQELIKAQQRQLASQQKRLDHLQREIDRLKSRFHSSRSPSTNKGNGRQLNCKVSTRRKP